MDSKFLTISLVNDLGPHGLHNERLLIAHGIGPTHHDNSVIAYGHRGTGPHIVVLIVENRYGIRHGNGHPHGSAFLLPLLDTENGMGSESDDALGTDMGMEIEKLKHDFWIYGQRCCHLTNVAT